ncbi:hypothetical protein RvY_08766 [Ramazzottius varieornatus]|uniref:Uncharacterized protein n=1 Tax=Ramazzottius varieornatus TaxID=947166 RepID=A0A1D1V994_RAMVA|nr:hypothetical protein RvY_08766 [Ramazzottius varieornatus]
MLEVDQKVVRYHPETQSAQPFLPPRSTPIVDAIHPPTHNVLRSSELDEDLLLRDALLPLRSSLRCDKSFLRAGEELDADVEEEDDEDLLLLRPPFRDRLRLILAGERSRRRAFGDLLRP